MKEGVEHVREIARLMAEHLPDYEVAPPLEDVELRWQNDNAYLIFGGGPYLRGQSKGLLIGQSWPRGRLEVSCLWPGFDGSQFSPHDSQSITVSAERPPQALARDIQRRLLAWYDEEWTKAVERAQARRREKLAHEALVARFAEIMGPAVCVESQQQGLSLGDVKVEVHSSDKATLSLRYASPALVEQVLLALKAQGVFQPVCGWENGACLKPADKFIQQRHYKAWFCDEHFRAMTTLLEEVA